MSSTDPIPPTAADSISTIRKTLSHLVSPTGLHIIPPNDAHLHSLSPIPLSTARRTLSKSLHSLLGSAIARESWDPNSSATDRLRRVKADTISKRRAIHASKNALAECKRLANIHDPFATPVSLAVQRLRAIADATGAITDENIEVVGATKNRVLTVCGTKFIADFHFLNINAQNVTVNVKFRHLTADDSEVADAQVDASFADYIKRQDFNTLKAAFEKLIAQEKLAEITKDVSLIDALRAFEEDLLAAQMAERKAGLDEQASMRVGHGVIKRCALGLSLKFTRGHTAVLGVEHAMSGRQIAVDRTHPCLPPELQTGGALVFEFDGCKMAAIGAQYVMKFHKPIFVCLSVAQSLERVGIGGESVGNMAKGIGQDFVYKGDRTEDGAKKDHCWPSLQKLLAPVVFGTKEEEEAKGDLTSAKELVVKRDHWSQQSAEFIAAAELPDRYLLRFSHSGSDMIPGLALHRVPLCHPRNVKPIFALIRQQIAFNSLFESCFSKPVYAGPGSTSLLPQPVEVVMCDGPSFMQFNLFDTSLHDILSIAVNIELEGEINVALKTSSDQPHVCSDQKASAILRVSRSIPLTILTIVKLSASTAAIRA